MAFASEHPVRRRTPSSGRSARSHGPTGGSRWSASTSPRATSRTAIAELERRITGGRAGRGAARRHRHRQVGHHGLADREAAAAHAGDGAEQDPRRAAGERAAGDVAATTPSSTSSRTTTTTSPRRTSRRRTPTSRRTRRSTTTSSGCGTRATSSLLSRRDVVVVASVSCIYGLGTPQSYLDRSIAARRSATRWTRDALLRALVDVQYTRNDLAFTRGSFRVRGDTVEIIPAYEELAVRIEFFGDEIEALYYLHPLTGDVVRQVDIAADLPGHPLRRRPGADGARGRGHRGRARASGSPSWRGQGKLLEAQRLRMRTQYDLEMIRQVGFCSGIENYSRHIDGRPAGLGAGHADRLLPGGLPAGHRRVARDGPADRRHVRGRHVPQAQPGRVRVPAAVGGRQPAADLGGVRRAGSGRPSTCRPPRGRTSWAGPAASSSSR